MSLRVGAGAARAAEVTSTRARISAARMTSMLAARGPAAHCLIAWDGSWMSRRSRGGTTRTCPGGVTAGAHRPHREVPMPELFRYLQHAFAIPTDANPIDVANESELQSSLRATIARGESPEHVRKLAYGYLEYLFA